MKKVLMMMVVAAVVGCTSSPYGQGGENACQFVKEQVPGLRDDIAKVEVVDEDSLLGDIYIDMCDISLYQAETAYYAGDITRKRLDEIVDSVANALTDLDNSWRFGIVVNDSLKKLEKYKYQWRKAYTIRVTMKSGTTKEPRVLMDANGVTPYCMERDMEKTIHEHTNMMVNFIHNIID